MTKNIKYLILIACIPYYIHSQSNTYPYTETSAVSDTYFGTQVEDSYRWLENDKDDKVRNWINIQNEFTNRYLEQIPYRESIKNKLEEYAINNFNSRIKIEKRRIANNTIDDKMYKFTSMPTKDLTVEKYINPGTPYWNHRYYQMLFGMDLLLAQFYCDFLIYVV